MEDIEKEFSDSTEVNTFISVMAPLLTAAMKLRSQPIADNDYYAKASNIKAQIINAVESPAVHLGIQHIQNMILDPFQLLFPP